MTELHMFFWKAIFSLPCVITMDHTSTSLLFLWSEEKGLGLWWFTPIFQLYRGSQFYWWKKPEYQEKTTGLPQVTDKHSHIKYTSSWSGIKLTTNRTLVVICSDCTGSCRSSYQTITTTMVCLNRIQFFLISLHRSVLNCTRYLPFLTFHHEYLYKSFKDPVLLSRLHGFVNTCIWGQMEWSTIFLYYSILKFWTKFFLILNIKSNHA